MASPIKAIVSIVKKEVHYNNKDKVMKKINYLIAGFYLSIAIWNTYMYCQEEHGQIASLFNFLLSIILYATFFNFIVTGILLHIKDYKDKNL